MRDSIIRK